jgi:hypothetical protein
MAAGGNGFGVEGDREFRGQNSDCNLPHASKYSIDHL